MSADDARLLAKRLRNWKASGFSQDYDGGEQSLDLADALHKLDGHVHSVEDRPDSAGSIDIAGRIKRPMVNLLHSFAACRELRNRADLNSVVDNCFQALGVGDLVNAILGGQTQLAVASTLSRL